MLADKVSQDLYRVNPNAKQLARDSRKVQMKRSKCLQATTLPGLANRNIRALNPKDIPADDQTFAGTCNKKVIKNI